ncbi:pantoate--beta-alanine ligase [Microbacterium sp. STN6]|uniref:pantoate--beta-alanine ligase n=1 Tax=Microbacterium sp. STN6 TaxID=2995588 RepID=UPI003A598C54
MEQPHEGGSRRPIVLNTIADVRRAVADQRGRGRTLALVPTMGALHDGHRALAERAGQLADVVVVSIFVNPLQFGPNEDLDRYPRTLDADVAALTGLADLVFAPSVAEMYPDGPSSTRVAAGTVASQYEGAARPGHFDGMLTVVSKLFGIVQPDVALFGQKDAQQAFLVERMVRELNMPLRIEVAPIVREADGLALSSRNRYLGGGERAAAVVLSRAVAAAASASLLGPEDARQAALDVMHAEPAVKLDYLVVVDPATFQAVGADHRGAALVLVAARVGETRLIDNGRITFPDREDRKTS